MKFEKTIIEQFLKISNLYSKKNALVINKERYTFENLLNKSKLIAERIIYYSKKDKIIAICTDRSAEQIFSIIACLLANKSYIILDEKVPLAKKRIILSKLNIKTIIIEDKKKLVFKNVKKLELKKIQKKKNDFVYKNENLNDIIYYIFTSGSTGEPKGIQINNSNLLWFVKNCIQTFNFSKNERFILLPYLSFDLSVFPLWISLCTGSTLYYTTGSDIIYPINYIKKNKITVYCSVPSQINLITNVLIKNKTTLNSVKKSFFCGEPLKNSQVRLWKNFFQKSKIFNTYGPSETTCFNTYYEIKKIKKSEVNDIASIGKPLPNNKIILKKGEIYIEGPQVSQGYIDKNHNNSFEKKGSGNFIYKTGDFAKKIGNNYHFLGRKDQQIKISGYRLELGEIEKIILKILKKNIRVVAIFFNKKIIIAIEGKLVISKTQKERINEKLPNYAIPSKYIHFTKFPLNKNFKIDIKKIKEKIQNEY